jgi:hypothetical protein
MIRTGFYLVSLACLAGAVLLFSGTAQTAQVSRGCESCHGQLSETLPKAHPKIPQAGINQCLACHSGGLSLERTIHFDHFSREKFTGTCWSCHEQGADGIFRLTGVERKGVKATREKAETMVPYFNSWAKSKYLDRTHALKQISCGSCHESLFPEERASEERCLECHKGYAAVAARTAKMKPNPHDHHLGEIRCTLCHKAHEPSVDYCKQCHSFNFDFSKKK